MNNRNSFIKRSIQLIAVIGAIIIFQAAGFSAEDGVQAGVSLSAGNSRTIMAVTAMGAVGISCVASAYALSRIGTAAMGAMSEKPEIGGRALIFLGMAEGIAIYALIIAIMLVNKI